MSENPDMLDEIRALIISCFSAPLHEVWTNDLLHLNPYLASGSLVTTEGPLDLSRIRFRDPFAGGVHEAVGVLYAPKSAPDTTVLLSNLSDGWQTLAHGLATSTPGRHVSIRSISGEYPLHEMHVWSDGRSIRCVRAMKDPRWDFFERGPRLEFEDSELYHERLVRRRLGRATLVRYLNALGWDAAQDGFWESARSARYVEERFQKP
jgi:hypothetical protein